MKTLPAKPFYFLVFSVFLFALLLSIMPLPDWLRSLRPDWVALVVIYWVLSAPTRVNVAMTWCMGLLLDVSVGTLLAEHSLALIVITYLVAKLSARITQFPPRQQIAIVFSLLLLYRVLLFWIQGMQGQMPVSIGFWLPVLISTLICPYLFLLLRFFEKRLLMKGYSL